MSQLNFCCSTKSAKSAQIRRCWRSPPCDVRNRGLVGFSWELLGGKLRRGESSEKHRCRPSRFQSCFGSSSRKWEGLGQLAVLQWLTCFADIFWEIVTSEASLSEVHRLCHSAVFVKSIWHMFGATQTCWQMPTHCLWQQHRVWQKCCSALQKGSSEKTKI